MNYFHATLLVLQDLYRFVRGKRVTLVIPHETRLVDSPVPTIPTQASLENILVPSLGLVGTAPLPEPGKYQEVIESTTVSNFHDVYVSVVSACVYKRPVVAFDECSFVVSYATPLRVDRHDGRFSHVSYAGQVGWILKDEVTQKRTDIFPVCTPGAIYDAYHGTTIAIRRLINDEFSAGELFLPLQSVEYVVYRLLQNGRTIPWPQQRPREPGTWYRLLCGVRGIHTDITPHTGAIMEWCEGADGCVAYTDIVRPNGTVIVSYVANTVEGQYIQRELSPEDCREKGALWIQIK